jgi:predicted ArsR family transcriptional regulator
MTLDKSRNTAAPDRTSPNRTSLRPLPSAADRLLGVIKRRGPQSIADLALALDITAEAARQQLVKLAADGLVTPATERRGVGRPTQLWRLTSAGHGRFPDTHAELTLRLIDTVRSELGEAALDRLIRAREAQTEQVYGAALAAANSLAERVSLLAALRSREGYMAEWQKDADCFLLVENHCPICAAATACQGFCRAELTVFRAVLGPDVAIERIDHILAGARRCAYRISPNIVAQEQQHGLDRRTGTGPTRGKGQGDRAPRRATDPADTRRARGVRLRQSLPA